MISKEHKKHTSLVRPVSGNFGRNEWAILGAPCINIKLLANEVINALSPKYKCAYADTSHNDEVTLPPGRLAGGAVLEYTDQLNYQQFNYSTALKPINFKQQFADADMVLVNGNHQPAKAQVVIIYNNKSASLQKRVAQLTNVELILLADNVDDVFDFIKEAVPNWQQLPVYRLEETDKIIAFFKDKMQQAKPVLNGLVLAGGQSIRMGHDKGALNWYGKEQRYYMADMLKELCEDVFISCRPEQKQEIDTTYNTLTDTFIGLGPFGAILSAFRENPNTAWLIVACDLPLLDANTLQYLIANRNPSAIATAYENVHDGFPEPLITIWEPKSYPLLLAFLAQGYSCPRKVLINSDTTLLKAGDTDALTNVNTPDDFEKIKRQIHQKIAST
ncbi:NTP transferase domain-containing protein [Mucilaginibacter sp.]|uniref:NTP transferase domain-containing protein n=1 Tax=Mucilaginibacter sp. TaxID=1882438 RepID=UPI00261C67B3|nr:NTP transferase domain-containing protein [Mucilaginibacter sp.]MDB5030699.1 molybdopterin-guanine dinucleotide biosynthesis protein MobA [Mucilaginibacter sp.]